MVIASGQSVKFSSKGRTASFVNGQYLRLNDPGVYIFTKLTIKNNAEVNFDTVPGEEAKPLTIGKCY